MTIKLIFDITLTIIIIYIFFIYNVEHATDGSTTGGSTTGGSTTGGSNTQFSDQQTKDIKNIINDLYMTDVDAIRNLSDVATKLQTQDKLILPGQLNVQGKLTTNGLNPSDMPVGWTGGLRFIDGYASGNMGFGPNATTINAQIDNGGNIMGKNLNLNGKIVTNDLTFNNSFTSGNMSFGPNATTINAQINNVGDIMGKNLNLNGKIVTNDLTFNNSFTSGNMSFGPNATTINARINKDGDIEGYNLNLKGGLSFVSFINNATTINAKIDKNGNISGNKLILNGELQTPNGHTFQSAGTQHIQGNGALYILYKDGLIVGKERDGSGDVSIQGKLQVGEDIDGNNLNLKGNLKVNNVLTTKNRARYIRVGNKMTPSIEIKNLDQSTNTDESPLAVDNWHLIEIIVLSGGLNVANNATVTAVGGLTDNIHIKNSTSYTNITNGKIFDPPKSIPYTNINHGYEGGVGRHLLEIDLTKEYDIDAIELYNRYDSSKTNNMNGTIVELISGDKLTINRRIHTGLWYTTYSKEYILN